MSGPLLPFRIIFAILLAPALVMVWVGFYPSGCLALVPVAAMAVVIFSYYWACNAVRARLIADLYFERGALFNIIMFSRIRLLLGGLVYTVSLTAFLAFTAVMWGETAVLLLAADALVVFLLLMLFRSLARGALRATDDLAPIIARQFAARVNAVLLTGALTWLALNSAPPDYATGQDSLRGALGAAAQGPFSQCGWIDTLVSWGRQVDALKWWTMTQATGQLSSPDLVLGAWLLFLLSGGVAALGFSVLAVQINHVVLGWDGGRNDHV
ncbi:MAG: hypothetical protein AAFR41_08170 [Pseudomonadota bacterium]